VKGQTSSCIPADMEEGTSCNESSRVGGRKGGKKERMYLIARNGKKIWKRNGLRKRRT